MKKIFSENGSLANTLAGFVPRESQLAMAQAVDRALGQGERLLVEAGTGVGKSLAYLIPLIREAKRSGESALVSTHTLHLQRQLLDKDIPLALKALGERDVTVARAMGRGNYFCHLRFALVNPNAGAALLPGVDAGPLGRLEAWAEDEAQTTRDRLPQSVDNALWERVNVDPYGCPGHACPHAARCHFLKERNAMARADLVVANHALVLSDLAARRQGSMVLTDTAFLVMDEAHHLEALASEHLGLRLGPSQLRHQFQVLDDQKGHGLLARAQAGSNAHEALDLCRREMSEWYESLAHRLGRPSPGKTLDVGLESEPQAGLAGALISLATSLAELRQRLDDEALAGELAGVSARLRQAGEGVARWCARDMGDSVYWLEWNGRENAAVLRSAPLDVGPLLSEELYARHRSVVLTSATLSAGGDFKFMKGRLGLEKEDPSLSLPSPFDYLSKVRMNLSAQIPDPRKEEVAWLRALPEYIRARLQESQGRAFVLFTAYRHLLQTARELRPWVEEQGWDMLIQEPGVSREALLERFRRGDAVLLGTSSFWEGVDVPGEALSSVVVTKLPFSVPDSPLEKARARRVEAAGGSYFKDLSLPEAQLRLKQGFGRLIRHENDEGWFSLLDPRVVNTGYGKSFLKTLPACRTFVDGEELERGTD